MNMIIVAGHYNVPAARPRTGVQFQLGNVQKITSVTRGLGSGSLGGRSVLLPTPYALVNAVTLSF
ncbi:hypothetical protein AJ87_35750 [Rhizobium yanglingense]|nr:hypothetical protein AJ87_35750 [Rhizobium yanglingense]